jgi:type I restriction enzyme S subunit
VTDKTVNPLFLSLYLNKQETRKWLSDHAVGSNMPNLNTEILASVPVELPSYEQQVKIATILQRIDDKILCNNRINDNLPYQSEMVA